MEHRTYGETRNCKGCRYWSEMIAGNVHNGGGEIEALCLAQKPAPFHGQYKHPRSTCSAWASGHHGAIDEPGQDPRAYEGEAA
jgi:hypothetical protein